MAALVLGDALEGAALLRGTGGATPLFNLSASAAADRGSNTSSRRRWSGRRWNKSRPAAWTRWSSCPAGVDEVVIGPSTPEVDPSRKVSGPSRPGKALDASGLVAAVVTPCGTGANSEHAVLRRKQQPPLGVRFLAAAVAPDLQT
jgi:hypothetical protein